MSLRRSTPHRSWPFWLLIAAWFCANTPQAATLHLFLWMKHAEHFSHQARLTRSVAALLGRTAPAPAAAVRPKTPDPERSMPALPESALAKKIDLSLVCTTGWTIPASRVSRWPSMNAPWPSPPAHDVPHPPPRHTA